MKELIEFLAKSLVDSPDEVSVNEFNERRTTIIELTVDEDDLGKVIGKQGRTARALRTVLAAAAMREDRKAVLEIIE
ncbi:MAG: KH domain-containing protein [Candidatus Poribacteria bacterium]|nr:KH domain-containing protein [Candidatus Poribacteria bacterium]